MTAPWTAVDDGLRLTVRLTPRGGRDAIDGVETLADGRPILKVRVRAAPSDGEANAALIALLARELDLPRSGVALVAGATARLKTVALTGDAQSLVGRLKAKIALG
ncbi:MAG TPA: DUF167 family protein [Bosea sp. (in: a-proteobacteria)]|uniref:DUF167 family protein n=1 Tax=Bosea sp. (in: a-proteobacteria) TaxID=1871050 RepID=UPI002E160AD9|nr:DUF167 family protein [Bosea sp. (in: a-proteobacteria)]